MKVIQFIKILSAVLLIVVSSYTLEAKHIVGGDAYYTCMGRDTARNQTTFQIDVVIYRDPTDPTAAGFNNGALFGVWSNVGNGWTLVDDFPVNFMNESEVSINEVNPCIIIPPNVAVDKAEYSFPLTLDNIEGEYMIAYQRCCRNGSISNIIDPQSTGAVFAISISEEAQLLCNDSPRFKEFPPIVICNGLELEFDHSVSDSDNDVVVYEFCAPRASGGIDGSQNTLPANTCTGVTPAPDMCPPPWQFVSFIAGLYDVTNPLGGAPQVTINPTTGLITGVPNVNGQFVVGVCAKEFRNGVQIGEIRRDFQFNVATCEPTVFAVIDSDITVGPKEFVINSCGNTTIDFDNMSFNEQYIVGYDWRFDINGNMEMFDTRNVTVTFPSVGEYEGSMIVNPNTDCADTALIYVNVYPEVTADFEFEYDTCVAGPIDFRDLSFTGADDVISWEWAFDPTSTSNSQIVSHLYEEPGVKNVSLIATDNNNCKDTSIQEIVWQPAPPLLIIQPNRFEGCAPSEIFINNLSSPIDSSYIIEWDFGDGNFSDEISPTHIYTEKGLYTLNLKVTTPIGCEIEDTWPNYIRIEDSPIADFTFSPTEINNFNSTVSFFDQSVDAVSWQWNFGGLANSTEINPTYTFRDTGLYDVVLVVKHPSNCPDTAIARIDVQPQITYFIPNAFTPNNDGQNDIFIGKGFLDGIREFEMQVWNRWGELVYTTDDQTIGWNGNKNNTGSAAPQGVYVYVVNYIGPRGGENSLKGHVTLLR